MLAYFLAIDVGTTAIKFTVIHDGLVQAVHQEQVISYQEGLAHFQRAAEILMQVKKGILALPKKIRAQISGLGFSTAMHSLMPVVNGSTPDKIFLWSDQQSGACLKNFKEKNPELAEKFYLKTGTPIHAMSPFAKILFFQAAKTYGAEVAWYGIKEWLLYNFCGAYYLDYSVASATGLFNLAEKTWDAEILAYLGVDMAQLATLVDTTATFSLTAALSTELGLTQQPQVLAGASDGCLAAYASFIATRLPDSLTIGTSGAVRKVSSTPLLKAAGQNFCYYLQANQYVVGAPTNNGGNILAWGQQQFFPHEDFYQSLNGYLKETTPGAHGLRFFPYVYGERAPFWSNEKSAEFRGFTPQVTRSDLARSLVEGVLMNLKVLQQMVGETKALSLSGGFFQNATLTQMAADILNATCYLAAENEPTFGLYYLAGGVRQAPEASQIFQPQSQNAATYEKIFANYFA